MLMAADTGGLKRSPYIGRSDFGRCAVSYPWVSARLLISPRGIAALKHIPTAYFIKCFAPIVNYLKILKQQFLANTIYHANYKYFQEQPLYLNLVLTSSSCLQAKRLSSLSVEGFRVTVNRSTLNGVIKTVFYVIYIKIFSSHVRWTWRPAARADVSAASVGDTIHQAKPPPHRSTTER